MKRKLLDVADLLLGTQFEYFYINISICLFFFHQFPLLYGNNYEYLRLSREGDIVFTAWGKKSIHSNNPLTPDEYINRGGLSVSYPWLCSLAAGLENKL